MAKNRFNNKKKISSEKCLNKGWAEHHNKTKMTINVSPTEWQKNSKNKTDLERSVDMLKYSFEGNKKMVRMAISEGEKIDINFVDKNLNTALIYAVMSGKKEVVDYLCEFEDLDLSCVNDKGLTALHIAVKNGRTDMIASLLKHKNANINVKGEYKQSPIFIAVENNDSEMIRFLTTFAQTKQQQYEMINTKNKDGKTPLLYACLNKTRVNAMISLLAHGADVSSADNMGRTPLMYAINNDNNVMVDVLLKQPNINIDQQAQNGMTALMCATKNANKEVIKTLIVRGSNVLLTDSRGYKASQVAEKFGNRECARMLQVAEKLWQTHEEKMEVLNEDEKYKENAIFKVKLKEFGKITKFDKNLAD